MTSYLKKNIYRLIPLGFLFLAFFLIIFSNNFSKANNQQFSDLANSFLHRQLYFLDSSSYNREVADSVFFNGHYYWPLGPLPALILMPLVGLGNTWHGYFYQGYLNFFLVILIAYLVFRLARRVKFSAVDSSYLSAAFVFSSMFLGVALISSSWYFAQTITVLLLFLALLEYFSRKRYFLIGLIFGLVLLSRVTAFIGIIFFLLDILWDKNTSYQAKLKNIFKLGLVPIICCFLLFTYNYARFGDSFDQGYRGQILSDGFTADKINYGLLNFKYLPRGAYYSLINMPQPVFNSTTHVLVFPFVKADPWGMSLFLTSPYLLYLFFVKIKDKQALALLSVSGLVWLTIATSFFIGSTQFGFRYALDFMPLLFTAFILTYKNQRDRLSSALQVLIIVSALLNLYLLFNL